MHTSSIVRLPGTFRIFVFLSALLLKATCADNVTTCFADPPGSENRSHVSLKVARRSWLSHELASVVVQIVLEEFLGFTVEQTSGLDEHTGEFYGPEMSSGTIDIDTENWYGQVESSMYQQYVVSEAAVSDLGSLGYFSRSGLFTFRSAIQQNDEADFYTFFRTSQNFSTHFQAQDVYLTFDESEMVSFLGAAFPMCNASSFSWCGSGVFEGYWASPTCRTSPGHCVEVYYPTPAWDTAYFEQLARNQDLAVVFGYYGTDMPTRLRELVGGHKAPVFYWWEPTPLLAELDAVRISFPDHYYGCDRNDNSNAETGSVACDDSWLVLHKLLASRVRDIAPEAFLFMSNLLLLQDEINDLIRHVTSTSIANVTQKQIHAAACGHIKSNLDKFMEFVPPCVSHPPSPVQDGDLIFDPTTLACESAVVYHTVPETHCFADSDRPGAVDRSDRTIKLVRREWLSHDLSSMVTEVVLREYLGYNVELVYNNRTPDWMFGPEMVEGHYDVDVEQWKAWPDSDNELEFLRTGLLFSLGPLGFTGRNGMYISSEAMSNPTSRLSYYKAYRNATSAAAQGVATHAESPLPALLGDTFPHPCPHGCGTGALEGYWAPQVCLDNPGRCIEVVNPAPSWDVAYGEQLINNLGLEAVVGYYGISGMFDVISSLAGTGKSMPFIWFEPDEFTLKQGAVRMSFPDYVYGCDLNNTMDPDAGRISCDWPPLDLVKIVAPIVRANMQEAYMVLTRMKIYTEMMNGLMADEGPYPERVCSFIRANHAIISEWAPDCLVRPLSPDQVRKGDMVFFPAEFDCEPITCPSDQVIRYEQIFATFYCNDCGDGELPDADQVQCSLCPLGQELDTTTMMCRPCLPGTSAASEGYCGNCPPGWFSIGGVAAECEPCSAGFTSGEAASSCSSCPPGTVSGIGAGNCTACEPGHFAATLGSTECVMCEIGTYASGRASSECNQCGESSSSPEYFVTMAKLDFHGETQYSYVLGSDTAEHCGCDRGRRWDAYGECVMCGEGMECPGLGDVLISAGYYSRAAPDLSVFKCHGDSRRCIGGTPGETCAEGRQGIACAECEENMMVEGSGCVPCADQDIIPFVMFIACALILLVLVDIFAANGVGTNKSLSAVFCVIALGQLVTALQVMSVVSLLSLEWENPFKTMLRLATLIALDVEVLRIGCVSTLTPLEKYLSKLVILLIGLCLLGVIHVVKILYLHYRGTKIKNKVWSLVAAVSAVLMLFYIPIASAVLQPLQCKLHPNGLWTVWNYQSVICWDSTEHVAMIAISVVVFFLVPIGFLVFVIVVLLQVTSRIQKVDARFVRTFSFLFFRFKPGLHWFAVVLMLKNLMLAVCTVIPDSLLQIIFLVVVNLIFWGLVLRLEPWRMFQAQVLDVSLTLVMLMVTVIASFYVDDGEKNYHALSWICSVMVIMVLLVALGALSYNFFGRLLPRKKAFEFFLCHHKAASGAFTRLLQMALLDNPKTVGDVFIDSDHLDNLDHLFEYVRTDTQTLVVIVTTDIFTRPWCVGEMTTARLAKVASVLVTLPGGFVPDDVFINKLTHSGLSNPEVLTEAGVDMPMICMTLAWLKSLMKVKMHEKISSERMNQLAGVLHHQATKTARRSSVASRTGSHVNDQQSRSVSDSASLASSSRFGKDESSSPREVFLVYDTENLDACAACHVLQRMLIPLSDYSSELVPKILDGVRFMPPGTATAIVMCTNGIFENYMCAKIFAKVTMQKHVPYPVLAEPTFRFPPPDVHSWLSKMFAARSAQPQDIHDASTCIVLLFKEIATQFQPNTASLSVLEVSAREVFRRVLSMKSRPTNDKMSTRASSEKVSKEMIAFSDTDFGSAVMTITLAEGEEDEGDYHYSSIGLLASKQKTSPRLQDESSDEVVSRV